jgi:hypothetical protein
MNTLPDPVDRAAQRLREAHLVLDERPRPGVRDAILRAAAGAQGARGAQPAAPVRERGSWLRWRPAFAAMGTASVAIVVVSVGLEMQRQVPSEGMPVSPATLAPAPARDPAPVASPPAPVATPSNAPASAAPPASQEEPSQPVPRPRESADLPAPPMQRPTALSKSASDAASGGARAEGARDELRLLRSLAPAQSEQAASRGATPDLRSRGLVISVPADRESAAHWLDRIIAMRQANRDREAEEELTRFRAAYPEEPIPAAALAR